MQLPAFHIITADKGMVEIAAVVFTRVSDPLTVCCALQNKEQVGYNLWMVKMLKKNDYIF